MNRHKFVPTLVRAVAALLLSFASSRGHAQTEQDFNVCERSDVLRALAYIYYGCGDVCDPSVIKQLDEGPIDRATLMGILSSPRVTRRHVFFQMGYDKFGLDSILDFNIRGEGSKRDQLQSLKTAVDRGGMVFILGKASTIGDAEKNRKLSENRMWTVRQFLFSAGVDCPVMKGGYFGADAFQFNESDAATFGIQGYEYRAPQPGDAARLGREEYERKLQRARYTLNQAVHVIFVPCPPEALFTQHRSLIWFHHRQKLASGSPAQRQRQARIRDTLFYGDSVPNQTKFLSELCTYCIGRGNAPEGSPDNATPAQACILAKELRQDHRECSRSR
jgi:hypothetical protein